MLKSLVSEAAWTMPAVVSASLYPKVFELQAEFGWVLSSTLAISGG